MLADDIRRYTSEIVTSYLKNHDIGQDHVPEVISIVHATLTKLSQRDDPVEIVPLVPAIAIRRSVTTEYLVCLDCGFRGRMLRRHLRSHGLSPEEYRKRWNLSSDYPVVAQGYAARRSEFAKKIGLGRVGGTRGTRLIKHAQKSAEEDEE